MSLRRRAAVATHVVAELQQLQHFAGLLHSVIEACQHAARYPLQRLLLLPSLSLAGHECP